MLVNRCRPLSVQNQTSRNFFPNDEKRKSTTGPRAPTKSLQKPESWSSRARISRREPVCTEFPTLCCFRITFELFINKLTRNQRIASCQGKLAANLASAFQFANVICYQFRVTTFNAIQSA